MSTRTATPGQAAARRRSWSSRHPVLTVVLVLALLSAGSSALQTYREHRAREPYRMVERAVAAVDGHLGTITPALDERWTNGFDPTEAQVKRRWEVSNRYLEPVFLDRLTREHGTSYLTRPEEEGHADRCWYLAVQPGGGAFDADRVRGIEAFCFNQDSGTPMGTSYVSAVP